jgi:hypothetical protein
MKNGIFLLAVFLMVIQTVSAQPGESLKNKSGHSVQLFYSDGLEPRATQLVMRVDKAMAYYTALLGFKPEVSLFVLSPGDWNKYSSMGLVYGMPHYDDKKKALFVAAGNNALWMSFIPPLDKVPAPLREQITGVYTLSDGSVSMEPFFDLLALHELGHAFHFQGGLNMQRLWFGELFVNIFLHTYIAEREPEALPALTVFPRMVVELGAGEYKYTSLTDVESRYVEVGRDHPKNYGWYQSRWHLEAGKIYDEAGTAAIGNLWIALKNKKEKLNDAEFLAFLTDSSVPSIVAVIQNWDRNTKF